MSGSKTAARAARLLAVTWLASAGMAFAGGDPVRGSSQDEPVAEPSPEPIVQVGRERLRGLASFHLDDIEGAAGVEAAAPLRGTLVRLIEETVAEASEGNLEKYSWAIGAFKRVVRSREWLGAREEHLDSEALASLAKIENARTERILRARTELSVALMATELRLRAPQVDRLRPMVAEWIESRRPTRSQVQASDAVDEVLTVAPIGRDFLLAPQRKIIERMRSARTPVAVRGAEPGDDLLRGRGRYPEDDFILEAAALAMFYGRLWEDVFVLRDAGFMLGREERRSGRKQKRFGDAQLFKSQVEPDEFPLWRALKGSLFDGAPADPGPALTGKSDALVRARAELITALLVERIHLREDQVGPVRDAFEELVELDYIARPQVLGALDATAIWRALRFDGNDPSKGAISRKVLVRALRELLDARQRLELGIYPRD